MTDTAVRDGTGRATRARVNSENRLLVDSVSADRVHISNHVNEDAYTITFQTTPTTAGNLFFYLKNTNSNKDLVVWEMGIRPASEEGVEVKLDLDGDPVDGTTIKPVSATTSAGRNAQAVAEYGVNITGLTNGDLLNRVFFPAGQGTVYKDWRSGIVMPPNESIGLYAVNGGITLNVDIMIDYHKAEDLA